MRKDESRLSPYFSPFIVMYVTYYKKDYLNEVSNTQIIYFTANIHIFRYMCVFLGRLRRLLVFAMVLKKEVKANLSSPLLPFSFCYLKYLCVHNILKTHCFKLSKEWEYIFWAFLQLYFFFSLPLFG